jgi:Zn-dependent oligopeptidase
VQEFEPKYLEFVNTVAYSQRYYQIHKIVLESGLTDTEQKRLIEKEIEAYELRGI